jgi:hypothetical protein
MQASFTWDAASFRTVYQSRVEAMLMQSGERSSMSSLTPLRCDTTSSVQCAPGALLNVCERRAMYVTAVEVLAAGLIFSCGLS